MESFVLGCILGFVTTIIGLVGGWFLRKKYARSKLNKDRQRQKLMSTEQNVANRFRNALTGAVRKNPNGGLQVESLSRKGVFGQNVIVRNTDKLGISCGPLICNVYIDLSCDQGKIITEFGDGMCEKYDSVDNIQVSMLLYVLSEYVTNWSPPQMRDDIPLA